MTVKLASHLCSHPDCTEVAAYGFGQRGIEGLFKPTSWYCLKHHPDPNYAKNIKHQVAEFEAAHCSTSLHSRNAEEQSSQDCPSDKRRPAATGLNPEL
jgi:hypothetical protein